MIGSPAGRSADCSFRKFAASVKSFAAVKATKLAKARQATCRDILFKAQPIL